MIVRPRPTTLGLLYILRGSIVPVIAPKVLGVVGVSAVVALAHHRAPGLFGDLSATPFTLLGLALSIFLGFRNNACYARWWEGRQQWGQLIAEIRGLLREALTVLPQDAALHRRVAGRCAGFAAALRDQLRDRPVPLRPDAIQAEQAAELQRLLQAGTLHPMLYQSLSLRLQGMTNIHTACERLKATPMPFAYALLLHRTAWLFCLLLPFGMVGSLGLLTPLPVAILAYAFFGLDALGEELERPFEATANALPLDALVRAIEIVVAQALGDETVPQPLAPVDYVLL
jgi:putative membrane protein